MDIINYLVANWEQVGLLFVLQIIFFDRLSKLTPTNSDNLWVERFQKVFSFLGFRIPDNLGDIEKAFQKRLDP